MIAKVRARHERGSSRKSGIPWLWLSLGAIGLLIFLAIALSFPTPSEGLKVGDPAPSFNLPSTDETEVALADYQGEKNVLLFFSMTDGCVPCMLQIKDLQKDTELQAMDVALVSIGTDPLPKLISAAREFGITTPSYRIRTGEFPGLTASYGGQCAMANRGTPLCLLTSKGQ